MLPITFTVGPFVAGVANLYVVSVVPTSGVALTLTGTNPAKPRRVLLTFGNEASARTLIVTGTNEAGNPIQETLTVPSGAGGTAQTLQDFATVTSALPLGGGWTAAATLGTSGVGSSLWKRTNAQQFGPVEISWNVIISGTVNWTIEGTNTPFDREIYQIGSLALGNYPTPPNPFSPVAGLAAQAGNAFGALVDIPINAWRATINSGTGSITVEALEAGVTTSGR